VHDAGLDGDHVAAAREDLPAAEAKLDLPVGDLEALRLIRVDVGRGHGAAGRHLHADENRLALRVGGGAQECHALAGDGILDCLSGANHFLLLSP
jgi:hypothetical protein